MRREVIRGALKISGSLDRLFFNSWKDYTLNLPGILSVEVPTSVSGVIASSVEPNEDERDKIWLRRDTSGAVIGPYAFQNGGWHPLYSFAENQIIWRYGDSANVPDGFVLIESGDSVIPDYVVNGLIAQYIPRVGGGWAYFACRFIGF